MKKLGALAAAVVGAAVMLVSSAGATEQSLAAKLSTRTGANLYLVQHGFNPSGFVIQRGSHNYAGPNCPGKGWSCTTATRVLQISTQAGRSNQADCSGAGIVTDQPGDCEIVQTNTDGSNVATCDQSDSSATAQQRCVVFQTNNGGGDNTVHVSQLIDTSNGTGTAQSVHQYIGINQQNQGWGGNLVDNAASTVINDRTTPYTQFVNESVSGGPNESQNSIQEISLSQTTEQGANHADALNQVLSESAQANVSSGVAQQRQNASSTSPNTNAGITQTTGSGTNSASLDQSHDLSELVVGTGDTAIVQIQGSSQGGLNSVVDQRDNGDNGISHFTGNQVEHQTQNVDGGTVKEQTQIGPMFGDPQSSNAADTFALDQLSTQFISGNPVNPNQHDSMFLSCDTQGRCGGGQTMTQNAGTNGNGCTGSPCNIQMLDLVGSPCVGDCPHPPPPDPPQRPNANAPTCVLMATVDATSTTPKQIKIEVQSDQGISSSGIHVDAITNATSDIPAVSGSTAPVIVTASKTDQNQGSFIRLTITDDAGAATTCDPIVPAVHTRHAVKAKTHVVKAHGFGLQLDAKGIEYGQPKPLTVTGSIPTGKAGEKVALLSSTCGFKGAAQLATVTTGPGGVFRYRFTPAITATFALRWNGRTSSGKVVRVRPQIGVAKLSGGRYRIDVSTTNGVFLTGTPVTLQMFAGGRWQTVGRAKLAPNSPVDVMTAVSSATIANAAAGRKLRALVPQTACYAGAASATLGG